MRQRVTLTDIAEQAGVSTATVSRVLNGKLNVADLTRRQVLVALDVLGYERPETLRRASQGLVGLIVPELTNPIFPLYAQEIEQLLVPSGHTPVLCTQTPGGTSEDEYVDMLVERGVAGIVFVSGRHSDTGGDVTRYRRLRDRGVPLVTINGNAPTIKAPGFTTDGRAAARMAVEHLVNLGHHRIGLVPGPTRMVPAQRKLAGYEDAVRRALPDEELHVVETLYTYEGGANAAQLLLPQGCTGIVCGSDIMALGVIQRVHRCGLRQRHHCPRSHPGSALGRPPGTPGRLGHRLRRLPSHPHDQPAAHHGASAGSGNLSGGGQHAGLPHRGRAGPGQRDALHA